VYLRALVYLQGRQALEAASEFQGVLQYRAMGTFYLRYPLSYIGLARAMVLEGDKAKAREA
jgi:hypothetical protein